MYYYICELFDMPCYLTLTSNGFKNQLPVEWQGNKSFYIQGVVPQPPPRTPHARTLG